jgi:hypothetical protein
MTSCCICMEDIEDDGIELPECGHSEFHANCIMQWFRGGNSKCPLCNDTGVGATVTSCMYGNEKIKIAKRYFRKGETDDVTSTLIRKLLIQEKKLVDVKKLISEHKKSFGIFSVLISRQRYLYSKRWKLLAQIGDTKRSICSSFSCVKMILVTKRKI